MLFQGLSVPVNVSVAGDHNQVYECPDSASTQSEEHYDAGGSVAGVESVYTQSAKHDAEDQGDKPSVLLLFGGLRGVEGLPGGVRLGLKRFPATWTKGGIRLDQAIRNEDNSSSLNMVINIIGSIVRIVFWLSKPKVNHYRWKIQSVSAFRGQARR